MSPLTIWLTGISLIGLLALSFFHFLKFKRIVQFISQLVILGATFGFLYVFFYSSETPVARGENELNIYSVIVLYGFMLLGMLAHYAYHRFSRPSRHRKKFDFGLFIAPVFTSPIIFLPLLSAMQNANIDLMHLTTPKLMVFLVAFENGFFWKEYFDNRRQLKEKGQNEK